MRDKTVIAAAVVSTGSEFYHHNSSSLYYAPLDLKIYRLIKQPYLDQPTDLHLPAPASDREMRLSDAPLSVRVTLLFIIIPPLFSPPHTCFIWKMWNKKKADKVLPKAFLVVEWQLKNVSNCHAFQAKNTETV